jgi:hypothetical protein
VSLLERIRDVVLRLIMLTAVSKSSVQRSRSSSSRTSSPRADGAAVAVTCRRDDSIRNEAVEECIEFLKRSSAEGDAMKLSNATAADAVATANCVAPTRLTSVVVAVAGSTEEHAAVAAGVAETAVTGSAEHAAVVAGVADTASLASEAI